MVNVCIGLAKITYHADELNKSDSGSTPYMYPCLNDTVIWIKDRVKSEVMMKSINGNNGTIVFPKESVCQKWLSIDNVTGKFINGQLEGCGKIIFKDKEIVIANFHQGVLNGVSRRFRCKFESCGAFEEPAENKPDQLGEVKK